ncbi:MAG: hypothetical protein U9P90_00730, partial [Patescibacteria group bacterium]|nr:hypothetical protein [Patescibacteria group bacterium]
EEYFKKAMSIWSPYHDRARIKFANVAYVLSDKDLALLAIDEIKKSAFNHPKDFSYPLTLGNLYTSTEDYSSAYKKYGRAIELSPKRQVVYFQFASAKFLAGEDEEARNTLRQAVELNPEVGEPHWRLGLGLIDGDNEEAIEEAKKAIILGYNPLKTEEIDAFASIYINKKNWDRLVSFYEFLVEFKARDKIGTADTYAQLAATYLQAGQKEKARDAAIMAAELDPNLKEATELFIKTLD